MTGSGDEAQNDPEARHKASQSSAGERKPPAIPSRQTAEKENGRDQKQKGYFSKFRNWINFLTLLFVAAYTVITFVQWRGNHIFNKKQMRAINLQLSEMRSSSAQTDQTIAALNEQAAIMRGQLDEMKLARRPWIAADWAIDGDLIYTANGAEIPIRFVLHNIGGSPAREVFINESGSPVGATDHEEIKRLCQRVMDKVGTTFFPGDKKGAERSVVIPKRDIDKWWDEHPDVKPVIAPRITVCITYKAFGSEDIHHTPFVLHVFRHRSAIPNRSPYQTFVDEGTVEASNLWLSMSLVGSTNAD